MFPDLLKVLKFEYDIDVEFFENIYFIAASTLVTTRPTVIRTLNSKYTVTHTNTLKEGKQVSKSL